MKNFWQRRRPLDLETQLRAQRPEPRAEFLHTLLASLSPRRSGAGHRQRLAIAAVVTSLLVAVVAASGSFGYAAAGAKDSMKVAKRIVIGAKKSKRSTARSVQSNSKRYVCHRTSSEKNPWHLIHVSENAVPAHEQHGDIIFPPGTTEQQAEAGCPPAGSPGGDQYGKRYICHRTGSKKNPWVLIHVSENAVGAHQAHGDIIFPPGTTEQQAEAGCPPR